MSSNVEESEAAGTDDFRSAEQMRYDAICDQVREVTQLVKVVIEKVPQHGAVQTVIHRNEGMGAWGAAAVTACFLTYLTLIIFAIWSIFQINNLWAWKDIHAGKIERATSDIQAIKESRK